MKMCAQHFFLFEKKHIQDLKLFYLNEEFLRNVINRRELSHENFMRSYHVHLLPNKKGICVSYFTCNKHVLLRRYMSGANNWPY